MSGYIGNAPTAVPLTSADIADGIITSAKIADGSIVNADINASAAIASTKLSGVVSGLTEADLWRVTANKSDNTDITANLERDDTSGFGYVGTGMTQSSGIFTFPSTGYYLVTATFVFIVTTDALVIGSINTTINNSSYTLRAEAFGQSNGTNNYSNGSTSIIFDVTSTANCKVKFSLSNFSAGSEIQAGTSLNYTHFSFIRLGDT